MRSPASRCSYWLGNSGAGTPLLRNEHRSLLNKKRLKNGRPAVRSGTRWNRAAQRLVKGGTYGAGVIGRLSNSPARRARTTRAGDSVVIHGWADCRSWIGAETQSPRRSDYAVRPVRPTTIRPGSGIAAGQGLVGYCLPTQRRPGRARICILLICRIGLLTFGENVSSGAVARLGPVQ